MQKYSTISQNTVVFMHRPSNVLTLFQVDGIPEQS